MIFFLDYNLILTKSLSYSNNWNVKSQLPVHHVDVEVDKYIV